MHTNGVMRQHALPANQGQILAVRYLAMKLPNSDLNFDVDFGVVFVNKAHGESGRDPFGSRMGLGQTQHRSQAKVWMAYVQDTGIRGQMDNSGQDSQEMEKMDAFICIVKQTETETSPAQPVTHWKRALPCNILAVLMSLKETQ